MKEHDVIKSIGDILDKYRAGEHTADREPEWPRYREDSYWMFTGVTCDEFLYTGCDFDRFVFVTQPVYKTEQNAEIAQRIWKRAIELRGDWRADFTNSGHSKHYLTVCSGQVVDRWGLCVQHQGTFYMPEHAAKTLLKEFTQEELKLWIEGEA